MTDDNSIGGLCFFIYSTNHKKKNYNKSQPATRESHIAFSAQDGPRSGGAGRGFESLMGQQFTGRKSKGVQLSATLSLEPFARGSGIIQNPRDPELSPGSIQPNCCPSPRLQSFACVSCTAHGPVRHCHR